MACPCTSDRTTATAITKVRFRKCILASMFVSSIYPIRRDGQGHDRGDLEAIWKAMGMRPQNDPDPSVIPVADAPGSVLPTPRIAPNRHASACGSTGVVIPFRARFAVSICFPALRLPYGRITE